MCPRCGSAEAVHSIQELAALAGGQPGGQPGYAAQPQAGPVPGDPSQPVPGWAAEPQAGPVPGYGQQPQAGPVPGRQPGRNPRSLSPGYSRSPEDQLGEAVAGLAAGFLGRAIGRRVQRALDEQVLPALAARRQAMLGDVAAIAQRYPGLCACLSDQVVFLAGGSRTAPMPDLSAGVTLAQADALVAQLQAG